MLKAVVKELNATLSVDKLFYQLSEGGSLPGSLLYESQDEFGAYTGFSIGIFKPSVCLSGKGEQFSYDALDQRGQAILASIKQHTHAVEVKKTKTR